MSIIYFSTLQYLTFRKFSKYLYLCILILLPTLGSAENNIKFLDKEIIKNIKYSIYEVVIPKVESEKIIYAKELPFEKLSYRDRTEKYYSIGTAFFLNDKELMTAAHVLNLEYFTLLKKFSIRDSEGNVYEIDKINKFSSHRDMTIFELKTYPSKSIPLEISENVEIGDSVFSVGNAQGEGISFRAGQVASFTAEPAYGMWKNIRFTSPASPGNSGGPLLDLQGKVLGVIIQKNASENYNVAVPISEIKKLGNKAAFLKRNISMTLNDNQNSFSMDWSENFLLPDSLANLSKKAQKSFNAFYEKISLGVYKKFETEYFPKGKRFRAYLRNQIYIKNFGELNSDANFSSWTLDSSYTKKISITENQTISFGKSFISTLHVIIDKPKNVSLSEFVKSPKMVMDNMLIAVPLSRDMKIEKIRLKSLGEPEKTEIWKDKLGRNWISSLWHLPHNNSFVYSHCLPFPSGVICNVDIKDAWVLNAGYLSLLKENLNEIAIGYEGSLNNWIEYISLSDTYLPLIFKDNAISLNEQTLDITMNDFSFSTNSEEFGDKTHLHMHYGYANNYLMAEDLLLFEIFPKKGVNAHYRVQKYFSPSAFSSDKYKSKWDDVSNTSGNYTGKLIKTNSNKMILNVISSAKRDLALLNDETIKREMILGCFYEFSEQNALKKCDNFLNSVKFN